jgi:hypothetical protein
MWFAWTTWPPNLVFLAFSAMSSFAPQTTYNRKELSILISIKGECALTWSGQRDSEICGTVNTRHITKTNPWPIADELKIPIHISHLPPDTSKWNKIKHCLISYIRMYWRGQPLVNYEVIINLIASTTNQKGLKSPRRTFRIHQASK